MTDLLILVVLLVLNGIAQAAWLRRRTCARRRTSKAVSPRWHSLAYPTHPSPLVGTNTVPEHAVRPVGIDG